jgi:regulator of protease activity HflC (stomatin/prohibitin superfamily)
MNSAKRKARGACLATGLTVVAASAACATVPSGHLGVLLRSDGVAADPLGEGTHLVGPLASVDVYDLRAQEETEDLVALSADGAPLEARASVLTFHPVPSELVALARQVGPDYYHAVIRPMVRSTVRRVLAGLRADQLDTGGILAAQAEITRIAGERLRPYHIALDAINIRSLALAPSSAAYRAVVDVGVREQQALAARQLAELARRRADALRTGGRGIAGAHALLAPTLTPDVLNDEAARAWTRLMTAPSTVVDVRSADVPYLMEVSP